MVQRVTRAKVVVDGTTVGELPGPGLLVYLGVTHGDGPAEVTWLARKVWELRRHPQGPPTQLERGRTRSGQ